MPTLDIKDFSQGWIPSNDALNGRKDGLLRMDNLTLDELGAVTVTKGTSKVNAVQFAGSVHTIYSRTLDATKWRYVGLSDSTVLADSGAGTFGTTIVTGGGAAASVRTAFGSAYGYNLICSGSGRKKHDGTNNYNLGIQPPATAVTVTTATVSLNATTPYASWTAEELAGGTFVNGADYLQIDTNATSFRASAYLTYTSVLNTMDFGSGNYGRATDLVRFNIRIGDTSYLKRVRLEFLLQAPTSPGTTEDVTDYYWMEWIQEEETPFRQGINEWSTLSALRKEFTREGTNSTRDWDDVYAVRMIIIGTAQMTCVWNDIFFVGSGIGSLNGDDLEWCQVNVHNNGAYLAKSSKGPNPNYKIQLLSSYGVITCITPADAHVNEVWVFRRGGGLETWYRVKVLTSSFATPFNDTVSNESALLTNIKLNEFLVSMQDATISNDIYYLETNHNLRTLYMNPREILVSDLQNPDAIDSRFTIKLSGSVGELNLWMLKTENSKLLVGTTNDIYELSGSFAELPDGVPDIYVRALGIKQPPVKDCVCVLSNDVFYIAEDGVRVVAGQTTSNINGNIDLLWRGFTRHGHLPVLVTPQNRLDSFLCVSKNRILFQTTLSDTSRRLFVFDTLRKYWYVYYINPAALFSEDDGVLLGGFADGGDFFLRILETGTQLDGTTDQSITLLTPIFDADQPLNRKDSFTLKLKIDTGGNNATLVIFKDDGATSCALGTVAASSLTEKFVDISSAVGITKNFQLQITGSFKTFKLTEIALEFESRPRQVTYLRLPPTNFGVAGRKRITELPLIIDTLGNSVSMTPYLDGVAQTVLTINTTEKNTINYQFTADKTAYDIHIILSSAGYFEFYDLIPPRIVELLPDPVKYLHIPHTNLGSYSRKRFITLALILDTRGSNVVFTPYIDGVAGTPTTFNTSRKQTCVHYFTVETVGVDVGGTLSDASQFEFYGIDEKESITEKLPISTRYLVIPQDDYGTSARKRFSSYKFVINTRGSNVTFTPRIDGSNGSPLVFSTSEKQTVEYFFTVDTIGIDIGGTLTGDSPFEFYGPLRPKVVEELPERLKFFVIPENNFGAPAKKRVRTIPLVINTNGAPVTFTPIVDGTSWAASTHTTSGKRTVFHYFSGDVFGVDFKGTLEGSSAFEFYGMEKPEHVEVLPVGKKFDQLGPIHLDKIGKVISFRVRVITVGTTLPWAIYMDDNLVQSGTFTTVANKAGVYEVRTQKTVYGSVLRVEFGPTSNEFHRYYGIFVVNKSGAKTDSTIEVID